MSDATTEKHTALMEKIVSLCKRRGFIFQSAEIYGGLNGCWDYGPLGAELKRNLKDYWWRKNVQEREDILGLDGSILTHQDVLKASGHVGGFSDPMCDCLLSKARLRADQIEPQTGTAYHYTGASHEESGWSSDKSYSVLISGNQDENKARKTARLYYAQYLTAKQISPKKLKLEGESTEDLVETTKYNPENGSLLTEPREFNLMFKTHMGASADDGDESSVAYLRPETAQGIFANFKNVTDSTRVKIPFGIAQIGKAFRNEITPRNFIFRSREFEQMEIEYFIDPSEETWPKVYREWIDNCKAWLESIGLKTDLLSEYIHPEEKLSHYSKGTTDIMFEFPFGVQELWGIACRGNFDLTQHENHSGKSLQYFDESNREKYVPHVVEPSVGVDRILLAVLCSAYNEDEIDGEKRVVLHFHPSIAPIKAAIFPLVKNKPELMEKAQALHTSLQKRFPVLFDASGNIGRRYRRQDEVGTPFGVTLDFDTLEDDTVTIRDRDTTEQTRIPISEVVSFLDRKIYG